MYHRLTRPFSPAAALLAPLYQTWHMLWKNISDLNRSPVYIQIKMEMVAFTTLELFFPNIVSAIGFFLHILRYLMWVNKNYGIGDWCDWLLIWDKQFIWEIFDESKFFQWLSSIFFLLSDIRKQFPQLSQWMDVDMGHNHTLPIP